ncbi:AlkA N-terminal domain-containing protein [Vibrio sp. 10N.261.55.A7]|uniref:DNA-3-methyladenine glycosylase 2 family protein n=1 Tax=Vibrio sp. 10N.261.55.A7 TaxID=1880851 RepID=UPI000C85F8A4|nr:AlkA N-terminal domain-containing protein [Vibrio sp. 10N.261.55.A7]PMK02438.1 3-methyladenine DNA glycosylase [Vibrio sp. 10N.261.55.A7]
MALSEYSILTDEQCQSARMARDPRFDGQFFIAVKTTGIFCRSICPANLPKEHNVEYFSDKAQALSAGYRPCLRCHPDSAPNSWAWKGVETTFTRASQLIDQGALLTGDIESLSDRLGISSRYLRRLFQTYLGLSPKQYAQNHQLMFAKQLLHNSNLSVTDIAFASGFNSVRRFNDAFKNTLKLTPTQVRKQEKATCLENTILLSYKGQLNWPHMLNFYRLRAIEGVETVTETSYERVVLINGSHAWFKAELIGNKLQVEFKIEEMTQLRHLIDKIRTMFDLDADTNSIEQHIEHVAPGLVTLSGLRIPGVWNPWEAGVRAILGQQVSVKAAIGQLNLLAKTVVTEVSGSDGQCYFPSAKQVAEIDLDFLRMPQSRKETLKRFALYSLDHSEADPSEWLSLKGIGPWTVDYALLRGLSKPDRFLEGDLIVKKAMAEFPMLDAKSLSPWGSYATFHCWEYAS